MARGRALLAVRDRAVAEAKRSDVADIIDRARSHGKNVPGTAVVQDFGIPLREPGDHVCGQYKGEGEERTIGKGKKAQPTRMFKFLRLDGAEIEIAGSSQLEKFFSTLKVNQYAFIERGEQIEGGAYGRVNLYTCAAWPVDTDEETVREEYTAWLEGQVAEDDAAKAE